MRVDHGAIVVWIPRQEIWIDAATGVELGVVYIDFLIESDLRADDAWAKRGTADDAADAVATRD